MMSVRKLSTGILLLLLAAPALHAAGTAGVVHTLKGRDTATTPDGDVRDIQKGDAVSSMETVSTASGSYARLKLRDESWIMLRPHTRFVLEDVEYNARDNTGRGLFALLRGGFRAVTGKIRDKLKYRYRTSVATIGIRGTRFMVRLCNGDCYDIDPPPADGLYVEVIDNTVVLSNQSGDTLLQAGEFAYIAGQGAPVQKLGSRPGVFVQSPIPVADPDNCVQ